MGASTRRWRALPGLLLIGVCVWSYPRPVRADVLQYGDGQSAGKQSYGGGGHLIMFDAGRAERWLNKIEMFGSRYGTPIAPDEDFSLYIVDAQQQPLYKVSLPYCLWNRGEDYWRDLPIPPIQVPQNFGVGLTFGATQYKGVYVGKTKSVGAGHSYSWTPGIQGEPTGDMEWLIKATVDDNPNGDPKARDLVLLRTGEAFFDVFTGAAGDPLSLAFAGRGALTQEQVVSVRAGAVTSPANARATVVLASGAKLPCTILSITDKAVQLRDASGVERTFDRIDVARIDFQ